MDNKAGKKERFKLIGINILLFIILFGLVTFNKQYLRPTFNHSQFALVLTGSFPNFIAAYLICLCVVNAVLIRKPKFGRQIIYALSFMVMAILIIEEYKSIWGASTQFDINDIIGSALGSLLAILTYEYLSFRKKFKQSK
jgi:branched-subunit amino acid transport protein AzlD